MAIIDGGVRVAGFISPVDSDDVYSTHDSIYGKGGHREVETINGRDGISSDRRREGMLVYVKETGLNYQLKGGILNSDWVEMSSGSNLSLISYDLTAPTGMGATINTIATRNAVVDSPYFGMEGWYSIVDEGMVDGAVASLYDRGEWIAETVPTSRITTAPYILGSNNEDILNIEGSYVHLVLPNAGLSKNIKIYSLASKFFLKKYSMNSASAYIGYVPDYTLLRWWYLAGSNNIIIQSNSIGDFIELSAGTDDGNGNMQHGIIGTSMISYYGVGNAGGWGNVPDLDTFACRFTLTASEYAKIADGSVIAGQWLTGATAPTDDIGSDSQFYLQSNGDVFLKASGTWGTAICNIATITGQWKDLIIYPTAMGISDSSPDLITFVSGGLKIYSFDGASTTEQLYGSFEMQHDYVEGSDLDIHVHWTPTTAAAGNVKWFFEYSIANMGGVFPSPTIISSVNSTTSTAWKHIYSDIGSMLVSGTGLKIGHCINFRLYRNPTDSEDTYTADAGLLSLGVHYLANSIGSKTELVK